MQFIPERGRMKAGRCIGLAFLWDLENCLGGGMHVLKTFTFFIL